ncbi:MAG: RagB/SusD family nutrient uptake outer membrane protein [Bacteroidota bacterium]
MKNKLFIGLILFAGVFAQSCEQFLEEELTREVTANNYYVLESGFEDGVRAIYETLDLFWGSEMGMTMTELGTDYHTNGADGGHKGFNVYDSRLSPAGDGYINDARRDRSLWTLLYPAINQCNAIVDRAADVQGMDPVLKDQRVGEARFLRGLFYFTLVKHFGDIHLSLEETMGIETESNRTDRLEVYSQAIIPDFEFAASVLPEDQSEYGRPTKPAAEFFLAKAVLTRGWLTNDNADFARAQSLMEGVINSYGFALLDSWGDLWDQSNQINSEVIWSVQNTQILSLNGSGHRFHLYFLMEYDKLPGMTRDTENGRPWKRARPTRWAEGLFNDDSSLDPATGLPAAPQALGSRADTRYQDGYKHVWLANNPGNNLAVDTLQARNFSFEMGDTALFIPNIDVSRELRLTKNYQIFIPKEYTEKIYPTLNKFIDPLRDNRQRTEGSRDFIMARLGDAYLIAAEAALLQGDITTATSYVNSIRQRAGREGRKDEMLVTEGQVDIDFILDERGRELAGEMHRWADLVRTQKLVERVRLYNIQAAPNIQDFHVLRPIPQNHIDAVGGEYGQNPGYGTN